MKKHNYTNNLINESSPYLLQHAHNPVNWEAWDSKILDQAKKENKLIIISIGYAACHWCHVMEHESFEDSTVAKLMNDNYINIKIDREERPDVDQVYMTAIQLMTGRGGWPLNVITLPDGRPVWGGTYFPKRKWMNALEQIADMYQKEPEKLIEYAEGLTQKIHQADLITLNSNEILFNQNGLEKIIDKWKISFDKGYGGSGHAPKFPLPHNYELLHRYAIQSDDTKTLEFVELTMEKIAFGGIYDHVGGGFARYSTDAKWHIPHFEKMLYDNAQLVSLYSKAYMHSKNEMYKEVVSETLSFVERELMGKDGNFFSSLDADSQDKHGHKEEGAFYVWEKEELKIILKDEYDLFKDYYNVNSFGKWEKDSYVLIKNKSDDDFVEKHELTIEDLKTIVSNWKSVLLKEREKRIRPGLDDKTLTSWNALMLKGYIDAYKAFGEKHYLEIALENAEFILQNQRKKDNGLYHNYKKGNSNINAYLEDYSTVIEAFIELYQVTFDGKWLQISKELTDYTFLHFYDKTSGMFYFTSDEDPKLINRNKETYDGVIPSSNSIMANNLFKLSHLFEDKKYRNVAEQMLKNVLEQASQYGSGFSKWLLLYCDLIGEFYEVVIIGDDAKNVSAYFQNKYLPNKIISASKYETSNPLFKNRFVKDKTLIYICIDGACKLPLEKSEDASQELNIIFRK